MPHGIRERFEPLNPWRKTLKTPFLRLEKENFDANGHPQLLNFYGISAKLYCLFNLDGNRLLVLGSVVKTHRKFDFRLI